MKLMPAYIIDRNNPAADLTSVKELISKCTFNTKKLKNIVIFIAQPGNIRFQLCNDGFLPSNGIFENGRFLNKYLAKTICCITKSAQPIQNNNRRTP